MAGYRFGNQAQFGTGNTISGTLGVTMGTVNTLAAGTTGSFVGGSGNTLTSGASQCVVFGRGNTLSGTSGPQGTWVGGKDNTVDAGQSIVVGRQQTLPSGAVNTAMFGRNCIATGDASYSLVTGYGNDVSGSYSIVCGDTLGLASEIDKSALFGFRNDAVLGGTLTAGYNNTAGVAATSRGEASLVTGDGAVGRFYGGHTLAGDKFATAGDAQTTRAILKVQTTDATVTTMLAGAGTTHLPILANDSAVIFKASIIARQTDADDVCGAWTLLGALDRNATAGTTLLLGSVTKTLIHRDVGTWDVDATADAVNGSLDIKVTGAVGDAVNWVCALDFTEVVG